MNFSCRLYCVQTLNWKCFNRFLVVKVLVCVGVGTFYKEEALVVAFSRHSKSLRSTVDRSIGRTVPRSGESSNIRSCGPGPGRAPRRTPGHSPETGAAESGPPPAPRPWLCWHLALEDICDPSCEHPQVTSGHCCLSTQWPKNICEWPKIFLSESSSCQLNVEHPPVRPSSSFTTRPDLIWS